nr:hypothetical protein [Pseudomonas sp. BIGb0427]
MFLLANPGGQFPGLSSALAVFTLGVTNGLCLALVGTYWYLAGKPAGAGTLLILQAVGLLAFWRLVCLADVKRAPDAL